MSQLARLVGIQSTEWTLCDSSNHDRNNCEPLVAASEPHVVAIGVRSIGGGVSPSVLLASEPGTGQVLRGDEDASDNRGQFPVGTRPSNSTTAN